MSTTLSILTVWLLAAAGIQLGTLWIMKLSILPMLNSLRYDGYVNVCQLIDMHVFHPIAVWNGMLGAGVGFVAAFLAPNAGVTSMFVLGSFGMLAVGFTSEVFNRPIWRQIEKWSPERMADGWLRKRHHWYIAHEVRTYAAIGTICAYIAAFIVQVV